MLLVEQIEQEMAEHARVAPQSTTEWATWWFRSAELHARWAAATKPGSGSGSAIHAYTLAAEKYRGIGDMAQAQTCDDMIAAHARRFGA